MPTICPSCGSQQPSNAAYCDQCGARLERMAPPSAPSPPTAVATVCHVCGVQIIPGEAFCDNCGAALGPPQPQQPPVVAAPIPPPPAATDTRICPNCNAQLDPDSRFCDLCGARVDTVPPPDSPAAPESTWPPVPAAEPTTPPWREPAPSVPPIAQPAPPPPPEPARTAIQGRLIVQGTNVPLPFPPGKSEILIGREDPVSDVFPDIDLTDHGGDESGVSRQHARITIQGNQVLIEDLNSTNYTHVNQQRLTPGQPHPLNNGDEVRFGRLKLYFFA